MPTGHEVTALEAKLIERFEYMNAIGVSLSGEHNIDRLLENILVVAKSITCADGGTLYRVHDDRKMLKFAIVRTDSMNIAYGGMTGNEVPSIFKDIHLYTEDGRPNDSLVAAYAAVRAETVNIADVYSDTNFDFSGTHAFDKATGYHSQSFLTVPMKNHEDEVIGILQLLNAIDPETGAVRVFSINDQRLVESLASQAAVALDNRLLIKQMEELFESFINVINTAIDEKSPYTGRHCQHVPVLTMMLADAVDAESDGPFADFRMCDQDRYELRIASLLHDCGKVTTPVHVVDKATKLQTIFDRIHLLNTRFEILRRDAEIETLKAVLAGANPEEEELRLKKKLQQIDSDRAFLRYVNIGRELMPREDQERVRKISRQYRWKNEDGKDVDFLSEDEIENLCIRSGTLTQAEREIMNYHIISTIKMLQAMPWPKRLGHVIEFAGGHHERIDGRGYPKGLTGDQMSVQARIMMIADIFEAMTARDRPYKKLMKLSEVLRLLSNLSRNGHIDPDLFDIFIKRKVYLDYAQRYLDPSQIDA
ncbi:MAG: GAF domain-containing protein [Candidatus Accumulibacter sp.]|jgi:HD-GYP domain-containing protein (c-di-GMP phosphodiesterase class II)|nr:GAF domain-containing protein [Accumulibacter sp.]